MIVEVYAPGDEAELFVNGESLGRQPLTDCRALFETVYTPGEIQAVSYENGTAQGVFSLHSPEGPAALTLSCELNGEELIYLAAELRSGIWQRRSLPAP